MAIRKGVTWIIVGGLIVALGLAFFVSPFASSSPDGLNKVAEDKGFIDTAEDHGLDDSPLAGYGVEGVDDESVSKGLSGIIGVAITFGIALLLFGIFHVRRGRGEQEPTAATTGG
jgi:hypothetical protein